MDLTRPKVEDWTTAVKAGQPLQAIRRSDLLALLKLAKRTLESMEDTGSAAVGPPELLGMLDELVIAGVPKNSDIGGSLTPRGRVNWLANQRDVAQKTLAEARAAAIKALAATENDERGLVQMIRDLEVDCDSEYEQRMAAETALDCVKKELEQARKDLQTAKNGGGISLEIMGAADKAMDAAGVPGGINVYKRVQALIEREKNEANYWRAREKQLIEIKEQYRDELRTAEANYSNASATIAAAREACPIVCMQDFGGLELVRLIQAQVKRDKQYQEQLLSKIREGSDERSALIECRAILRHIDETAAECPLCKAPRIMQPDSEWGWIGEIVHREGCKLAAQVVAGEHCFKPNSAEARATEIGNDWQREYLDARAKLTAAEFRATAAERERDAARAASLQPELDGARIACVQLREKLTRAERERDELQERNDDLRAKLAEAEAQDELWRKLTAEQSRRIVASERVRDAAQTIANEIQGGRIGVLGSVPSGSAEVSKAFIRTFLDALSAPAPTPAKPETCGECQYLLCTGRCGERSQVGMPTYPAHVACDKGTRRLPVVAETCGDCDKYDPWHEACATKRGVVLKTDPACDKGTRRLPVVANEPARTCGECERFGMLSCRVGRVDGVVYSGNPACPAFAPRPAAQGVES